MANVLIADDEKELAGTLAEVLRGAGHQVRTASGGAPALALAHDSPPDLLISDLALGSAPDGLALIEEMRVGRPQLRVILMTAYRSDRLRTWLEANPSWGLLEKPFSLSDFRTLVNRLLGVTTPA